MLGDQNFFVTPVMCKKTASIYPDATMQFDDTVKTEKGCLDRSKSQEEGCCIKNDNTCVFTTKANCQVAEFASLNETLEKKTGFHKDMLCSNDVLSCNCAKQQKTGCVGEDIYWFDSCGNKENIYDADKRKSYNDGYVLKEADSCVASGPNDPSCGNCQFPKGTVCGKDELKKMPVGDSTCVGLGCKEVYKDPYSPNSGGEKKNGESWCIYDSQVGLGKDLVGSRHYKHICINGEEIVETCKDFREEICVQGELGQGALDTMTGFLLSGADYTEAACRTNRWSDCDSCNTLNTLPGKSISETLKKGSKYPASLVELQKSCCNNIDVRDCYWMEAGISDAGGVCVPLVKPGLKHWGAPSVTAAKATTTANALGANTGVTSTTPSEQTCAKASQECDVVYRIGGFSKIFTSPESKKKNAKIIKNEICTKKTWVLAGNNLCKAQGDCGAYFNILGQPGDGSGYLNTVVFETGYFVGNTRKLTVADYGDFKTLIGRPSDEKKSKTDVMLKDAGFWTMIAGYGLSGILGSTGAVQQGKSWYGGFASGLFGGASALASMGKKCDEKKDGPKCTASKDCKAGEECKDGKCTKEACKNERDCMAGQDCNQGQCVTKGSCTASNQCAADEECKNNKCEKKASATATTPATTSTSTATTTPEKPSTTAAPSGEPTGMQSGELKIQLSERLNNLRSQISSANSYEQLNSLMSQASDIRTEALRLTEDDRSIIETEISSVESELNQKESELSQATGGVIGIDAITGMQQVNPPGVVQTGGNAVQAVGALVPGFSKVIQPIQGALGGVKSNVCGQGFAGKSSTIYGKAGTFGSLINLASMLSTIYVGIEYGAQREATVKYTMTCKPWQAPTGSTDCEKCNDPMKPCSEYKCKSLGQNCAIVNAGTTNETCISLNVNDVNSPIITPDKTRMQPYTTTDTTEEANKGVRINEKIRAFSPVSFSLLTNEPAQCKYAFLPATKFEQMTDYFGSSMFLYNQSLLFSMPAAFANANVSKATKGEVTVYVRCQDANGNKNERPFFFKFQVDTSPDLTPPTIMFTSLASNAFLKYNETEITLKIYTDEPATCKWSRRDTGYDLMENTFECITDQFSQSAEYLATYECATRLKNMTNLENNLYFKCKDKPDAAEDKDRNTNEESYKYTLKGTQQTLRIASVGPTGTIFATDTALRVTTESGSESGKANCAFSESDVPFSQMIILLLQQKKEWQ
ncbi:MAG: hypothetical protein AABY09_01935 [Nanoarchaeota archaeon]